jgi:hypothetical protein
MSELDRVTGGAPLLRKRLSGFLGNHSAWKRPLRRALGRISENSWSAVIFGGVLRDLFLFGASEVPRDVDIVVEGVTTSDLEGVFHDLIVEKNRFGGLRLRIRGWLIDIWCFQDTWAIRNQVIKSQGLQDLVRTTFLNVEAVAAEINTVRGRRRQVFSSGFFDAVQGQVLDINLESNPHPALCVIRTIITAIRLDFFLSPRLATYVVEQTKKASLSQVMEAQESHYGKLRIRESRISAVVTSLAEQLTDVSTQRLKIPATRLEQLELWKYWDPAC